MESTSKILSPSCHYLVQATSFPDLDYSGLQIGLTAFILATSVLILNTTAEMIHLKRKRDHAGLLCLPQKKFRVLTAACKDAHPEVLVPALPLCHPLLRFLMLVRFLAAKHTPASRPVHLFPLLLGMFFLQALWD